MARLLVAGMKVVLPSWWQARLVVAALVSGVKGYLVLAGFAVTCARLHCG